MRLAPALALLTACASAPPPPAKTADPVDAGVSDSGTSYSGLGVESVPAETLVKYAAKPLPRELSSKIQAMLDVRAPGAGVPSSDGKRLYFGWTITGVPQIFRLDGPQSFPIQLTGGEDVTTIAELSGGELLIQRDRAGEENPGLYRVSVEGGPLRPIQHKPKVQTLLDYVAEDGRWLLYRANDRTPESYAIYRYDLAKGAAELIFGEPGIWSVSGVREAQGRPGRLLLQKSVGSNMAEFYELDVATRELTPRFGQGENEDYLATYGPGDDVIVLTPKFGEFRRLYRLRGAEWKPISPEMSHDVSSFSLDRPKTRILYSVNEGGYTRLGGLDAKSDQPLELPKLPEADHVLIGSSSSDGRYTSFLVDTGLRPAEAFVYDWKAKKLVSWHRPATPEIDVSTFVRAAPETYPARDGTKIPMFVRRSKACAAPEARCPVIVSFHGGPESQTRPGFDPRAQLFVDAGFVWVEPNVRGSDGYGKSWVHADDGKKRLAVITDVEDVARYVRTAWAKDGAPPKVGVYGGSYGGYTTLMAMTYFAGAYDAGVSLVGISSLLTFLENTAPYRRILRISEYGDPTKDREALTELSPIHHIDKLAQPLMLIQGATDPRVPVGEALQFYRAAEAKGVPSELVIFPDEGHGMRKRGNQVLALGHTLRFFLERLSGSGR